MKHLKSLLAVLLLPALLLSGAARAEDPQNDAPLTLESLLEAVREGRVGDRAEDRERIARFRAEQAERERLLAEVRDRRAELEARSAAMETRYEENDQAIGELEERLRERMGSLKELFGVLQQVASDAQGQFHVSLTRLEHPDRGDFLVDFAGRGNAGTPPRRGSAGGGPAA